MMYERFVRCSPESGVRDELQLMFEAPLEGRVSTHALVSSHLCLTGWTVASQDRSMPHIVK